MSKRPAKPLGWCHDVNSYGCPHPDIPGGMLEGAAALAWWKSQRFYYKGDATGRGVINRYIGPTDEAGRKRDAHHSLPSGAVLLAYDVANKIHLAIAGGTKGIDALMAHLPQGKVSSEYLIRHGADKKLIPTTVSFAAKAKQDALAELEKLGVVVPAGKRDAFLKATQAEIDEDKELELTEEQFELAAAEVVDGATIHA